ncbi:MAG TPA: hypothetical protein VFD84_10635 [Candidatus Binatia bacterium]|nr:hypothetical protein [Candidatus Binatia bacterium]
MTNSVVKGCDDLCKHAEMYAGVCESYQVRRESSRRVEWIVNAALWAGIVAASLKTPKDAVDVLHSSGWVARWIVVIGGVVVGVFHFILWELPMYLSQRYAQDGSDLYLALALKTLKGEVWTPPAPKPRRNWIKKVREHIPLPPQTALRAWRTPALQSLITGLLAAGALSFLRFVVQSPPCPK